MSLILLITRPRAQAQGFAGEVLAQLSPAEAAEVEVVLSPLLEIVPVPLEAPLPEAAGVIFTSQNGVEVAGDLGLPRGLPAYCVGQRTAAAAREAGFEARRGPGHAAALADQLLRDRPLGPLLHIRGRHSRGEVAARLDAGGLPCREVVAYDQDARPLSPEGLAALAGEKPVVLPLFSPRTSTIFQRSGPHRAPVHAIAISVAARLEGADLASETVAASPDARAMRDATVDRLRGLLALA